MALSSSGMFGIFRTLGNIISFKFVVSNNDVEQFFDCLKIPLQSSQCTSCGIRITCTDRSLHIIYQFFCRDIPIIPTEFADDDYQTTYLIDLCHI